MFHVCFWDFCSFSTARNDSLLYFFNSFRFISSQLQTVAFFDRRKLNCRFVKFHWNI